MLEKSDHLKPRKKPVQSRSEHTVEAILEATVQVLLAQGAHQLTTTKVADRAGVSIGTLYQYFGDKKGLLSAVIEKHLLQVSDAIEEACRVHSGAALDQITHGLVDAFFEAKFRHPEAARAMYALAAELDGARMVAELMQKNQVLICQLLSSARDFQGKDKPGKDTPARDTITASFVVTTCMIGPVQSLLMVDAPEPFRESIKTELKKMILGYLKSE